MDKMSSFLKLISPPFTCVSIFCNGFDTDSILSGVINLFRERRVQRKGEISVSNKRFWLLLAGLLAAVLLLAACGSESTDNGDGTEEGNSSGPSEEAPAEGGSEGATGDVRQITITASNFKFDQEVYTVSKGDTVEITFENAEGYHEATIDGYDVKLSASEPVTFVADQSGEFDLFCTVVCGPIDKHNNMRAKFVVEE
jgi:cytochrome c oxidase subunit 2